MRHHPGCRRRRPKLCAVCHGDASWAVATMEPTTTVKRDGTVLRGFAPRSVFYCEEHVGDA